MLTVLSLGTVACATRGEFDSLQRELSYFVSETDAHIGIAVIIDNRDTVGVNLRDSFPMLSVYKFPIALALGEFCRQNGTGLDFPCTVTHSDLLPDTYSPMRDKYDGLDTITITMREVLSYALQHSDNNASDLILKTIHGPSTVQRYLREIEANGISVTSTEAEMHLNNSLCYDNFATPIGMATLMNMFDVEFTDSISCDIKQLMETCSTGTDRLAAPLRGTDAIIGHKTGTGFTLPDGRLMAINDCGYVHMPDGHHYSIAVFIENSGYDAEYTAGLIAQISEIVFNNIK